MLPALAAATAELPADQPRYLMGVGDPAGLVEAIALGVDMFDCVLPTRLARHGTVLTDAGRLNLRNARFATDDGPLDPDAARARWCAATRRAYLRHLLTRRGAHRRCGSSRCTTCGGCCAWWTGSGRRSAAGTFDVLRADVLQAWGGR